MERDNAIRRIMVVEDNESVAQTWKARLQTSKTKVDTVMTGEECLAKLQERNGYNLIIADYNLPGIKGDTLCLELKLAYDEGKMKKKYHKMFIMMSADNEVSQIANQHGITFAAKPDNAAEWREIIQVVEWKLQQTSTILDIQELKLATSDLEQKIDTATKSIDIANKSIESMNTKMDLFFSNQQTTMDLVSQINKRFEDFETQEQSEESEELKKKDQENGRPSETAVCEVPKNQPDILVKMRSIIQAIKKDDLLNLFFSLIVYSFILGVFFIISTLWLSNYLVNNPKSMNVLNIPKTQEVENPKKSEKKTNKTVDKQVK